MKNKPLHSSEKLVHLDAILDEALTESFPASDPIAVSFPRAVDLASNEPIEIAKEVQKRKKSSKHKH
ncbi:hypothetical protein [Solimicrobium silvestre]|uniref:Uncharacterized protein n=1 Tax=Solimicrobium silvestre TaxID=2099400 RepID=A0A2S9GW47_9BURK|nr:hypothetical protein [Solimicrobium silvestre]PRC91942.1 hypothetical protein S2091_3284 [Solimicrobium silvestre]